MYKIITRRTIEIKGTLTEAQIHKLRDNKDLKMIQFDSEVDNVTFQRLNDILFSVRDDIVLRVYGFYQEQCDFSFLKSLPNLVRFHGECYEMVQNIQSLGELKKLKELKLSIFYLDSFDILSHIPDTLEKLVLGKTKSTKPALYELKRFKNLKTLFLIGHKKGIEALSSLENIEKLTLTSVSINDFTFLLPLHKLWYLSINFGSVNSFSALGILHSIKYLELFQIRKVEDLSFISFATNLQYLSLGNLPNVSVLPALNDLTHLRKIELENMKGLKDLSSLEYAPQLVEFSHRSAMSMQIEDYIPLLKNPILKRVSVGFGSDKKNNQFDALAEKYGKSAEILWHNPSFIIQH
ncbi:leucine-rich repeat domain-containing protein [Priestia koreensis]|uniref:leucine-rich repeat domain-containing protein n=1 Tax=Priestia koreensis TaxID=284581 RepID=UPI00203AC01B|nr:hypothetical protein [Priestia koreensis]MCM3006096.1 hypothetical protein [Priestia koreensis]